MNGAQIDRYLRRQKSPLAGYGAAFVRAGRKYGVNPALMVAIAGAESSFGRYNSGAHNAWGWGPGIDFPSWQAGIEAIAKGLRQNYLGQGLRTVKQIGSKWAPAGAANDPTNLNSHWTSNVEKFFGQLRGGSLGAAGGSSRQGPAENSSASAGPDLTQFALQGLSEVGKGYDPLQSLSSLAEAVKASGGNLAGGVSVPNAPGRPQGAVRGPGITYKGQRLTHDTDGLPGYPAVDLFAKPGTPFKAPEDGKIVRISGHPGTTSGNVFGQSVYFQGRSGTTYFITHLGTVAPRGVYRRGQALGTVSRWDSGSPHAHVGVHRRGRR